MPPKLFRFTQFRKNASATPLVSHTFKTKDLKPFRFTHFQKNGRGWVPLSNLRSSLSPLDSALTSKRAPKSFTCNTYEKHTGGEGGAAEFRISRFEFRISVTHQSRVTTHQSRRVAGILAFDSQLSTVNCAPHARLGNRGDRMSGLANWVRLRKFAFRLVVALFILA